MMKIVIDARMYGHQNFTGIGRYTEELIRQLEEQDTQNHYIILLGRVNYDLYSPVSPRFSKQLAPFQHYSFAEQFFLPIKLYSLRPDLVHFMNFNAPFLYLGRRITTIHDLTMVLFAARRRAGILGIFKQLKRLPARFLMWYGVHNSKVVIVPTQYVKDEIVARYKVEADKIAVTLQGVSIHITSTQSRPKDVPPGNFLFYVGTYYPHKNIHRLIEAFAIITLSKPELVLILAGKVDYTYEAVKRQVHSLGLSNKVIFQGFVTNEELGWLFAHATAFVFPSLSEGFGLPGLEAMAYKTPVIAARATCLPEVYGDAADYMNPLDSTDMAADILNVLNDSVELERLKQAGNPRVEAYSWKKMSRETRDIYRQIMS